MVQSIYPRDFFSGVAQSIDSSLCFVLMPFEEKFKSTFDDAIKPTVEEAGFRCLRSDSIFSPEPILLTIMEHIAKAGLIIADLSEKNPNVFYELGMSHVIKPNRNVILLARNAYDVPFDLRHLRLIIYQDNYAGFIQLRDDLSQAIKTVNEPLPIGQAVALEKSGGSEDSQPIADSTSSASLSGGIQLETTGGEEARALTASATDQRKFGGTWDFVKVTFSAPSSWSDLEGSFCAALLKWYRYDELTIAPIEVNFPKGSLKYSWQPFLMLDNMADPDVAEFASATKLPIRETRYFIELPFDVTDLSEHLKRLRIRIASIAHNRIVLDLGPYGVVELSQGNEGTEIAVRCGQEEAHQAGYVTAYEDVLGLLNGSLTPEQFSQMLYRATYGLG